MRLILFLCVIDNFKSAFLGNYCQALLFLNVKDYLMPMSVRESYILLPTFGPVL